MSAAHVSTKVKAPLHPPLPTKRCTDMNRLGEKEELLSVLDIVGNLLHWLEWPAWGWDLVLLLFLRIWWRTELRSGSMTAAQSDVQQSKVDINRMRIEVDWAAMLRQPDDGSQRGPFVQMQRLHLWAHGILIWILKDVRIEPECFSTVTHDNLGDAVMRR